MVSNRTTFHVAPYNDRWQIKRDGADVFELPTKAEAVDKAAAEARLAHPAQVVIHTADGKIEDERTYEMTRSRPAADIPLHGGRELQVAHHIETIPAAGACTGGCWYEPKWEGFRNAAELHSTHYSAV